MIVVDASVVLDILLCKTGVARVERRVLHEEGILVCPALLDVEVAHVLRRHALADEMTAERGQLALDELRSYPLLRYPHEPLVQRAWDLRHNMSAYDAMYVALAEMLEVTLLTRDRKLAATRGHDAEIEVV